MTRFVALLRAVNVGGNTKVAMADLVDVVEASGLRDVRSLIQSGNLVFDADTVDAAALEDRLENAARRALGLDTDFMIRSAEAWSRAIAANPFPAEAGSDPSHLLLIALKSAPPADRLAGLRSTIVGRERIELSADMLYAVYPDGIGRSKLTTAVIERKLGTRGTGRNWNTVAKLAAMVGA